MPFPASALTRMSYLTLVRASTRIPSTAANPLASGAVPHFAAHPLRPHVRFAARAMTSSSMPLQEWLVIAPDFEGALEKRLAVRQDHLSGLKADPESFWLWGGAMLEEPPKEGETPKMKGSAMLIGANTREEVIERLKNDVYVKGSVWDWDKVQIIPFKSALRKAL